MIKMLKNMPQRNHVQPIQIRSIPVDAALKKTNRRRKLGMLFHIHCKLLPPAIKRV